MLSIFTLIRLNAGGVHFKTFETCICFTLLMFLIPPVILNLVKLNFYIELLIFVLAYIFFLFIFSLYAPSTTVSKPIKNINKIRKAKFNTIITLIVVFVINVLIKNTMYQLLVLISVLYEVVLVLPVTHKLIYEGGE